MTEEFINILEILKKEFDGEANAELPEEGDIIFEHIINYIDNAYIEKVVLNFWGIESFTNSFINNSIGRLYMNFPQEVINKKLVIKGLTNQQDIIIIRESIQNAIQFAKKKF